MSPTKASNTTLRFFCRTDGRASKPRKSFTISEANLAAAAMGESASSEPAGDEELADEGDATSGKLESHCRAKRDVIEAWVD